MIFHNDSGVIEVIVTEVAGAAGGLSVRLAGMVTILSQRPAGSGILRDLVLGKVV